MTVETFSQYLVKSGIFNKGQGLATLQDQMAAAFPVYVDEVLVPAIVTGSPNTEPAAGWHHAICPNPILDDLPWKEVPGGRKPPGERVVRLRDVLLALEGIDGDQRDGGWWETSKGVEHGKDIMHKIIQASFLPHDGATKKSGFKPDPVIQNNSTVRINK